MAMGKMISIEKFIRVEKWPSQALVLPTLQAHRGYWKGGAQENTIAAFREARLRGALQFECDVRLSKDLIPVVFHDEDLQRLGGRPDRVDGLTANELKRAVSAPTLQETLTDPAVPRFVNIELKSKKKLDDSLERRVSDVVKRNQAQNRVLFSSFNPMSLYRISLYLPDVPRALLVTHEEDSDNHFVLRKMLIAPFLKFHLLHLNHHMVTEDAMKVWRARNIPVAVWTVNGQEQIQKFLRMGCVSVISDTL